MEVNINRKIAYKLISTKKTEANFASTDPLPKYYMEILQFTFRAHRFDVNAPPELKRK